MREDFAFLKSVAKATPKLTIPSPSTMHFRGGRRAIDQKAYPDIAGFYADLGRVYAEEVADLARAGCSYLQIDEVNLAYLCDPKLREQVRSIGEDPESLPKTYAKLINAAIATRPPGMTICMHLCRGNFQSAWVAEGGYDPVAEILFNEINVDGYFLEYDTPRAGSFAPLRFVPKGKRVVLGLVTTKKGALEKPEELKRRIEEAAALRAARPARAQPAMRLLLDGRGQPHNHRGRDRQAPPRGGGGARSMGIRARPDDSISLSAMGSLKCSREDQP